MKTEKHPEERSKMPAIEVTNMERLRVSKLIVSWGTNPGELNSIYHMTIGELSKRAKAPPYWLGRSSSP